jgi:hypothetical protein
MSTISERRQHLDFDSSWRVVKWDVSDEFVVGIGTALNVSRDSHQDSTSQPAIGPTDGVKAADVIGVRDIQPGPKTILVAEFKDFTWPNIPPHEVAQAVEKSESADVIEELVRKVIDTLAGATFSRSSVEREVDWFPALRLSTTKIFVLVCLETPDPLSVGTLSKELQRRLQWLGKSASVLVTSSTTPFSGEGVSYRIT